MRKIALALAANALFFAASAALAAACPKTGGQFVYAYEPEPTGLNTIGSGVTGSIIASKIYESLLSFEGPSMTPRPGIAESWTVSPDGLSYSFKLQKNVKWHDGSPMTAADVKFSVEKVAAPMHTRGKIYYGSLESITTPDPHTVVFKLVRPVPYFLSAFQPTETPIFPSKLFTEKDTASRDAFLKSGPLQKPVGTGPFMFKEWSKGNFIRLVKNPAYWVAGKPCLDEVVLRVMPDASARAVAIENGEIDLAPMNAIPELEIPRLQAKPNLVVSTKGTEGLGTNMWLDINLRDKTLSDVRVRKAISMALDRKAIVNVIWSGHGVPARGPLVSVNPFFNPQLPAYVYDLKQANALLDAAGYTKDAKGVRFTLSQNFLPYGEKWIRLSEYIRQQLKKVGIEVQTKNADLGGWLKTVFTDWDYQMTSTFTDNRTDPTIGSQRLFTTEFIRKGASFTNSMGYSNPVVDSLFKQAADEVDTVKRRVMFDRIQTVLHEELPVIFLVELANISVWNKRVHGIITNGTSFYSNWADVWKD